MAHRASAVTHVHIQGRVHRGHRLRCRWWSTCLVNDVTSIYVSTVKDDGTLNPPREVAKLPHGETGNFLYSYLDRYLVIGTSAGVRVADCWHCHRLPIGPVIVELMVAVWMPLADGDYIWFTGGTTGVTLTVDGTAVPACTGWI